MSNWGRGGRAWGEHSSCSGLGTPVPSGGPSALPTHQFRRVWSPACPTGHVFGPECNCRALNHRIGRPSLRACTHWSSGWARSAETPPFGAPNRICFCGSVCPVTTTGPVDPTGSRDWLGKWTRVPRGHIRVAHKGGPNLSVPVTPAIQVHTGRVHNPASPHHECSSTSLRIHI